MKLLEPTRIGNLALKNRMAMAPMTRSRANDNGIVGPLTALYYKQRASAGLIISEGINISEQGKGSPFTPGIYNQEQIEAWQQVTREVHQAEGKIFAQLWHTGRVGHPLNKNGQVSVAPSAIAIKDQLIFTPAGEKTFETPRALSDTDIKQIIADYQQAAINAMAAGFDGVELHAASGYLPNQFLVDSANTRTDQYGGSIENRSRFVTEVMAGLINAVGPDLAGIKLSPTMTFNGVTDSDPAALFGYLIKELNKMPVAYIHLMQPFPPFNQIPAHYPKDLLETFGGLIQKFLIFNGGLDRDKAENILKDNLAQMVSFGSLYLANPDLPKRFKVNAAMNAPDRATMYGGTGEKGYTDYPFLEPA